MANRGLKFVVPIPIPIGTINALHNIGGQTAIFPAFFAVFNFHYFQALENLSLCSIITWISVNRRVKNQFCLENFIIWCGTP